LKDRLTKAIFIITLLCLSLSVRTQAGLTVVETLDSITTTANTGQKPQSKVWKYDDIWWCVLPSLSATTSGTWIWKLSGTTWTEELLLSTETNTAADVKVQGSVVHILLYDNDPELVSVEYIASSYQLWASRPVASPISLPSSETSTIDIDTTGRMWLSTEAGSNVVVYYSDSPYSTWNGPVTLASGIGSDDITVITKIPNNKMGVLWSDQTTKNFGFRWHTDIDDPNIWSLDEKPASQSALNVGKGMADDHLNVAVASDGTLYAAVKTSYDTVGYPLIALLVRSPTGVWDDLYGVDDAGTRGIVVLNETESILSIIYTSSEGSIVYKQTALPTIALSSKSTLINQANNNVTSLKENVSDDLLVLASDGSSVQGVLATFTAIDLPAFNPVAHYMMEEDSGSVLVDSSVYGNNANLLGNPSWVTGISGLALEIDGANDYALASDSNSLNITGSVTLAAWVKPEKTDTQRLIRKVGGGSGYSLFLSANGYASVRFNNNNSYRVNTSALYPNDGNSWVHIAATYDGSSIRTYIDGLPDTSTNLTFSIMSTGSDMSIGAESDGSFKLQGTIDDVRIYNRALDASEIALLADNTNSNCNFKAEGDINRDCKANLIDFIKMASNWLLICEAPQTSPACVPNN